MPRKKPRNPSLTAAAKKAHEQVKIGFQWHVSLGLKELPTLNKSDLYLFFQKWLCDLDEVKGLTVGATYHNSCSESSC